MRDLSSNIGVLWIYGVLLLETTQIDKANLEDVAPKRRHSLMMDVDNIWVCLRTGCPILSACLHKIQNTRIDRPTSQHSSKSSPSARPEQKTDFYQWPFQVPKLEVPTIYNIRSM